MALGRTMAGLAGVLQKRRHLEARRVYAEGKLLTWLITTAALLAAGKTYERPAVSLFGADERLGG